MSKFDKKKMAITLAFAALFGNKTSAMNTDNNIQKGMKSNSKILKIKNVNENLHVFSKNKEIKDDFNDDVNKMKHAISLAKKMQEKFNLEGKIGTKQGFIKLLFEEQEIIKALKDNNIKKEDVESIQDFIDCCKNEQVDFKTSGNNDLILAEFGNKNKIFGFINIYDEEKHSTDISFSYNGITFLKLSVDEIEDDIKELEYYNPED